MPAVTGYQRGRGLRSPLPKSAAREKLKTDTSGLRS